MQCLLYCALTLAIVILCDLYSVDMLVLLLLTLHVLDLPDRKVQERVPALLHHLRQRQPPWSPGALRPSSQWGAKAIITRGRQGLRLTVATEASSALVYSECIVFLTPSY